MKFALWIVQGLLAVLFLALGVMKLTAALDDLSAQMGVPGALVRFIGFVEVLGVAGLILPAVTRILPGLVPLTATGLAVVALLATGHHLSRGENAMALFPLVVTVLAAFVAYGRWRLVPHGERSERRQRERELAATR